MFEVNKKTRSLDPRAQLLLLIIVNIIAFTYKNPLVEFIVIGMLAILLVYCNCEKSALKWLIFFGILVSIQYYLIPILPKILVIMFTILTIYVRKIFPCLMVGTMIVKTVPVRFLIIALRKWHLPQSIIIPLSITLRYFPAIKEEHRYIKDVMKLRKINGLGQKLECLVVPLLMSAVGTADELSAAAITRGIENPIEKTCVVDLKFYPRDYASIVVGIMLILFANII